MRRTSKAAILRLTRPNKTRELALSYLEQPEHERDIREIEGATSELAWAYDQAEALGMTGDAWLRSISSREYTLYRARGLVARAQHAVLAPAQS